MTRSPRSDEWPMAFTGAEFWRGALAAVGYCLIGVVLVSIVFSESPAYFVIVILVALLYAVPVAFVSMLLHAPLAWLLGLVLQRVRAKWVHVVVFALLGALSGFTTMLFFITSVDAGPTSLSTSPWGLWVFAVPAVAAVPLGWLSTSRRALRADRGVVAGPQPRRDSDAEYEDAR